jgi:hypothetical protein
MRLYYLRLGNKTMTKHYDDVIKRLKEGTATDADVESLTDDDIRQLVIHYATLITKTRDRKEQQALVAAVATAWNKDWPRPLWDRFMKMVLENKDSPPFWARPARLNNAFGIKE